MLHYKKSPVFFLVLLAMALVLNLGFAPGGNEMMAAAEKKSDILFLKGKFILRDKKGSIVISDDKKCHCG